MEERKTTILVVGIIAVIVAVLTVILPEIRYRSNKAFNYKSCTINFNYGIDGMEADVYRVNQNRFALCLCDLYQRNPDTATANKIVHIYKFNNFDTTRTKANYSLDSIIKHRYQQFDTLVLID